MRAFLQEEARNNGFDLIGITRPNAIPAARAHLQRALAAGYLGTMDWMEETFERRVAPDVLWPDVRSVIMLAMNYGPGTDPRALQDHPGRGAISVYARHRDYHDLIKGRLKQIASRFAARTGEEVKVFVDTAPVMEKPLAAAAGLGWQGKHTNLVSRTHGSWLFLGSVFTTADLGADAPENDHCGSCRACLDSCPTHAFPAPYQLDARRCISYLTIELKEQIPPGFRKAIGNRIYGCDDCLAACPWNKFAQVTHEIKLQTREELKAPALSMLLGLDDRAFRHFFSGSPVKRIGRDRFIRNALLAAGNSNDANLVPHIEKHMTDPSPLVRGMAVWALHQLLPPAAFETLRKRFASDETDDTVKAEWETAT
ncbi:MAG: Epoxyqueuosine reductase [Candidatus Tokpelaia hoelldobleri]|uniref:Epoxyqueuosine reductase n=1 Tax=Candidatus Tokpelaia hoelldobleri TaxID=1902579 RepID=A0A1U9JV22_9HYPH|nr:MAG: Epoxyqueuosine reductase [Candidatus Tokpelaia hoelldoblerii]